MMLKTYADTAQCQHTRPLKYTEESPWAITNDPVSLTILGSEKQYVLDKKAFPRQTSA